MRASINRYKSIAPCGMNCSICYAHLRDKNQCHGCRSDIKPISCTYCKIATCEILLENNYNFCYECTDFPCKLIKNMDKRYRTKYNMSTIANLENIRDIGIRKFTESEKVRWTCKQCGGVINVHKGICSVCSTEQ